MELRKITNLEEYNKYVRNHQYANIMQSSHWGIIKDDSWKSHILGFYEDNQLIGSALLLERKAFSKKSFFYCSRGMLIDYENELVIKESISLLKEYVKEHNGFVLRFDPELPLKASNYRSKEVFKDNAHIHQMISKYATHQGFGMDMSSSMQPRFQMVVDLGFEDLMKDIRGRNRPFVRDEYFEKRGFIFEDATNEQGVKDFSYLSRLTEERQGVALRNEDYFKKLYDTFNPLNEIKIFISKIDIDKLVEYLSNEKDKEEEIERLLKLKEEFGNIIPASGILCILGTNMVQMFYSGNNSDVIRYRLSDKTIYNAIMYSKEQGYKYFNLGGVAGTLDDHLVLYKTRYNPMLVEYLGDYDIVINKFYHQLFVKGLPLAKKIRNKVLR